MADAQPVPQITKGSGPDQLPEGGATEVNAIPQEQNPEAGAAQVQAGAVAAGNAPHGGEATPAPEGPPAELPPHPSELNQAEPPPASESQPFDAPVNFSPQGDDEQHLFETPTSQIGRATPGGSLTAGAIPPPPGAGEWLPTLQMAASDPNAAPQVRDLFNLITYHLSSPQGQ